MGTTSALIGAHAVPVECPFLDIPIAAYAGTFGNPWGPLHCYIANDSTGSTDGQNLKSKKANIPLIWNPHADFLGLDFQVTIENGCPSLSPAGLVHPLRLSLGGIGMRKVFIMYQAASACILILNCGMQSVTAICLSSHISVSFTLSEIKILIRIISQGEGSV